MGLVTKLLFTVLSIIGIGLIVIYFNFRKRYQHWKKKKGLYYLQPSFPFGNFEGIIFKNSIGRIVADHCLKNKDKKVFGVYFFNRPILLVNDLELMKDVLVQNFSSFHDRLEDLSGSVDPLLEQLPALNGKEWRNLRIKLIPTFTSGKMKMMFQTLVDVGDELKSTIQNLTNEDEVEIKDLLSRYTMDVISSCGFGIESHCLKDKNSKFMATAMQIFQPTFRLIAINALMFAFPKLLKYLRISILPKNIHDFFFGLVRDTIEYREKNNVQRNDFMQLLIELKNLGYVTDANSQRGERTENKEIDTSQKFTVEQATAQAFVFFFAGFETSASTLQFLLYELAINPNIQHRLQTEIDGNLAKNNGKLTYEGVHEMEYLDMVVSETLRKYPIAPLLSRICTKDYKIPDTGVIIEKGTSAWISALAYHHDPEIYPEPDKFDPDRFLPEEKAKRHHFAYIPFGEGPRNCIGNRFALMQVKTAVAVMLSKFTFEVSKSTQIPLILHPRNEILMPKDKICLKIKNRSDQSPVQQ